MLLAMYKAPTYDAAVEMAAKLVDFAGAGHTSVLYVDPLQLDRIKQFHVCPSLPPLPPPRQPGARACLTHDLLPDVPIPGELAVNWTTARGHESDARAGGRRVGEH